MTVQEAKDGLIRLFDEYELNLPYTDSLEVLHFAIKALEKYDAVERAIKHLEKEGKFADEEKERCARKNPLQFDRAVGYSNGIFNAIEFIKGEME